MIFIKENYHIISVMLIVIYFIYIINRVNIDNYLY